MPEVDIARIPGRDFPHGEVVYDSLKHGWGGWRDHTEHDGGGYEVRGPLCFTSWPGPYGDSLCLATGVAAAGTARYDNSSSAYLNLARYFTDVAAQAGGKPRYTRVTVKFSTRMADETKLGWKLTLGIDTQAADNSWRGFIKLVMDMRASGGFRWIAERGNGSTYTGGGLVNAPIVGNNESKGNEGSITFVRDNFANDGKGKLDHAIINGAYVDLTGVGDGEYGAQTVQTASPFAHGENIGIFLTNSTTNPQPIRANIHRVIVEVA